MRYLPIILFFLASCSPTSLDDYHHEGEAVARSITSDLKKIHTKEEFLTKAPKLKKKFHKLVDLIISARKFQQGHSENHLENSFLLDTTVSDDLLAEMRRLYQIQGIREIMEEVQSGALNRLEIFHKS